MRRRVVLRGARRAGSPVRPARERETGLAPHHDRDLGRGARRPGVEAGGGVGRQRRRPRNDVGNARARGSRRGPGRPRRAGQALRLRRRGALGTLDRRDGSPHQERRQHRHRWLGPRPGHGLRGAEAVRARGAGAALHLQHRSHRRPREDRLPRPRGDAVHRRVQDLHDARDPHQRPPRQEVAAGRLGRARRHPRGRQRPGALGDRAALRRRVDGAGQGQRVRDRPGQRLRVLGLGGRSLLRGLRHRHLARRGHRAGAVRRAPRRHAHDGRALPHHPAGAQRPRGHGPAQHLELQLPRRPHARRAALRAVPPPLPGLPPTAHHGVQRQERAV